MPGPILTTGDLAVFEPAFGPAIAPVPPIPLVGTSNVLITGRPVCVEGDEMMVIVPGIPYICGPFTIPGLALARILTLGPMQRSFTTHFTALPVLTEGMMFISELQVLMPAMMPPPGPSPPIPDPVPIYPGEGMFVTANFEFEAM